MTMLFKAHIPRPPVTYAVRLVPENIQELADELMATSTIIEPVRPPNRNGLKVTYTLTLEDGTETKLELYTGDYIVEEYEVLPGTERRVPKYSVLSRDEFHKGYAEVR